MIRYCILFVSFCCVLASHASTIGALKSSPNNTFESLYAKAYRVREFSFPLDHGSHDNFKTEWWYFTGNLEDSQGRKFGYQLTIFRNNIHPGFKSNNAWRTNQIYMGHFAITDIVANKFYSYEVFQRSAKNLAGASPERIHLNNWLIDIESLGAELKQIKIQAAKDSSKINLVLKPSKKVILQGDSGLSQKSSEPGNASYYYSYTNLETQGSIQINGKEFVLKGKSWMDREWSTSALAKDQSGWDWFALQLSDKYEIMHYQLREAKGISQFSNTAIVNPASKKTISKKTKLKVLGYYISKKTKIKYPSRWQLEIPEENLVLEIKPLIQDQEHKFTYSYWEGAVEIKGSHQGKSISGKGYVELTGY